MEKRERKPRGFWTKEQCYEAARECKTRKEFEKKYSGGYNVARKNGLLNEYHWFVDGNKLASQKRIKWTKERCYEAAQEYKSRNEFAEKCGGAYEVSWRNGWLDGLFPKRSVKWTKAKCYEEARKYSYRSEFREKCSGAYNVSWRNGWLDEYHWFVDGNKLKAQKQTKWTYETCKEEAKKYKTRNEFSKKCSVAYNVSRKNGWLDDYFWFKRQQNPFTDKMDNVYCYYFTDFNSVYVGRTVNIQKRDYDHRIKGAVYDFARKNKTEVSEMVLLETNLSLEEGLELEDYYVNKFKKEGWRVLNKAKTGKGSGSLGAIRNGKWAYESCKKAALACKTRSEFQKKYGGAYNVSCKNGWLDEFFSETKHWTYETCKEEAKKYSSRNEFAKKCSGAYNVSRKNGWLDEYHWFVDGNKLKAQKQTKWTYETCKEEAKKYKTRNEFQENCARGYYISRKNGWLDEYHWFVDGRKLKTKWTYETCKEEAKKYSSRNEFSKNCGRAYQVALKNKWLDGLFPKNKKTA